MELKQLTVVNSVKDDFELLVSEYSELFTGLGKLRGYKAKLHIDDSVQPVTQTHRRVPFHVRKDLEAIKQMTHSESFNDLLDQRPGSLLLSACPRKAARCECVSTCVAPTKQ